MKILVIAKGDVATGLGHIVRARTFVESLKEFYPDFSIFFFVVGNQELGRLIPPALDNEFKGFVSQREILTLDLEFDLCFFDSISLDEDLVCTIKSRSYKCISLSPIFDQMHYMDHVFIRTKNFDPSLSSIKGLKIHASLKYTLIENNCYEIDTALYQKGLLGNKVSVAISMGGTDADNKTLEIIRTLSRINTPSIFWVMLGEGYHHSFDEIRHILKNQSEHEIILAHTFTSMWEVLNRCSLLVTTSGITSYEALFAGLPTLLFYQSSKQQYLVQELIESEVSIPLGVYGPQNLASMPQKIEALINNKRRLMKMHLNCKGLVDKKAAIRIIDTATGDSDKVQ